LKVLKIPPNTLNKLRKINKIQTIHIGNKYLFNLQKFLRENNVKNINKRRICYCRVSSKKQIEDLKRQIAFMMNKYPSNEIIFDIGSSINFNRSGLNKIIDYAINGKLMN
jgi:putative resolvase